MGNNPIVEIQWNISVLKPFPTYNIIATDTFENIKANIWKIKIWKIIIQLLNSVENSVAKEDIADISSCVSVFKCSLMKMLQHVGKC